jgi:hypothetical protein
MVVGCTFLGIACSPVVTKWWPMSTRHNPVFTRAVVIFILVWATATFFLHLIFGGDR